MVRVRLDRVRVARRLALVPAFVAALLAAERAGAEMRPSLSFGGGPGLVDMPSGEAMPDGQLAFNVSNFGPITRTTMSFQITPWVSGSFRLQKIRNWNDKVGGTALDDGYSTYTDRGFDIRFHLLHETANLPALTIGLQDFAGTGLFASEYVAATKTFGDSVKVTAGLGWGRFGSYGDIGSPFGTRPVPAIGMGSRINANTWFRGPAAFFGGVEWQINERWRAKAEYASDAYEVEAGQRGTFRRRSPLNFGLEYQPQPDVSIGLYSLYGSEFGVNIQLLIDPKRRPTGGVLGEAPIPMNIRPSRAADPEAWEEDWVSQPGAAPILRENIAKYLDKDGIEIEDFAYTARRVQIRIRNSKIDATAQAIGRTARALSYTMPASVEVFEIVPVERGMAASRVTIRRSDLERLESAPNNHAALRSVAQIEDVSPVLPGGIGPEDGLYPRLTWSLLPAFRPSGPVRGDIGLRLSGSYALSPGWVLSGSVYQKFLDNYGSGSSVRPPTGTLPHVRRDFGDYVRESGFAMERLTLAHYGNPAQNIYTRLTFGYLERMHAGVSGEVLWHPTNSRWALGAELNYTKQRDRDGRFGFGDYDYSITTGHVSAYYDFGNGFLGQVDVGRYLAGDKGATFSIDREFANGWKVGAFATITDASAEEFGEGRFDKGVRVTIPINWLAGKPTRQKVTQVIRPLQRDGGARLDVDGRLYEVIREGQTRRIDDQWGRVWR